MRTVKSLKILKFLKYGHFDFPNLRNNGGIRAKFLPIHGK